MIKLRLNVDVVLPSDAAACDSCTARLLTSLRGIRGVDDAHVDTSDPERATLCLHYDPNVVRLEQVQQLVERAGIDIRDRYQHVSEAVSGLRHEGQAKLVEGALARVPGVLHASVSFGTQRVYVELDPARTTRAAVIAALGGTGIQLRGESAKTVVPAVAHAGHGHGAKAAHSGPGAGHGHAHGGPFGERSELIFSTGCGAMTLAGWIVGRTGAPPPVALAMFVVAYVLGAWFTVQEVVLALRARKFEIDFLMLLAAVGAAALGEWFEGALLLFLFTLGHSLEGFAMGRARKAIEALSKLVPETAVRVDAAGSETEVNVSELVVGDHVMVKPNTRIPADGFVISGSTAVNQAPITGESVPVDKRPVLDLASATQNPSALGAEHRVYAGTINGSAAITTYVAKAASDSTLARVGKMVAEAASQKSPTQQFTDRFEKVFVPVILTVVVLLLFAWLVVDETFSQSFYRAMAVLVAASPCALAIATPSAVLSGVARAARGGVLIKGGAHLEALGLVRAVAFDKTGTLTEGKPVLTDFVAAEGVMQSELLQVALTVERQSDHPLASAIVTGASARLGSVATTDRAESVEAIIGFGVRAVVGGSSVSIGKPALFVEGAGLPSDVAEAVTSLQAGGKTVMVVKKGDRFLGVLGVMDEPRESARQVISSLYALGIEDTIMLTGDNQRVADAVAKAVGIRDARGDLLPEAKVEAIKALASSSRLVAMVGDGVNDAPAMANATVGIAMGAGGSDVALETADVALMADDLLALPFAIGLSRAARRIIRQNLWASLGMVALLVPATIFDVAGIGIAVALHEGSTLLVVVNALRLLAYSHSSRA